MTTIKLTNSEVISLIYIALEFNPSHVIEQVTAKAVDTKMIDSVKYNELENCMEISY